MESEKYIPRFELCVEHTLEFTILLYAFLLTDTHFVYKENNRSVRNISIPSLLEQISKCLICVGVKENLSNCIIHSIPLKIDSSLTDERYQTKDCYRSEECTLLCNDTNEICVQCIKFKKIYTQKSRIMLTSPAHKFAPLSKTSKVY